MACSCGIQTDVLGYYLCDAIGHWLIYVPLCLMHPISLQLKSAILMTGTRYHSSCNIYEKPLMYEMSISHGSECEIIVT